jgi:capsular exopolysaccharide synthesis family protein
MSRVDEALRRASGAVLRRSEESSAGATHRVEDYPAENASNPTAVASRGTRSPLDLVAPVAAVHAVVAPRAVERPGLTRLAPEVEGKIVIDQETSPASIEEYRRLATGLHLQQTQMGLQVMMVSSAAPRDGKTLTSTNLALTLSESYKRRVLLIDADLRRPSIHTLFRIPNVSGLGDALRDSPVNYVDVSTLLTVLPAGNTIGSPMAALTSDRMRALVTDARRHFDWIIIDTPPVGLISDASLLAGLTDGVLLVVGAATTPYRAIQRAIEEVGRNRILGVILNRVHEARGSNAYYDSYYSPSAEAL